jgi:hypothetical protein
MPTMPDVFSSARPLIAATNAIQQAIDVLKVKPVAVSESSEVALQLDPATAGKLAATYRAKLVADHAWRLAQLDVNVLTAQQAHGAAVDPKLKQPAADAALAAQKVAQDGHLAAVAAALADLGVNLSDYNVRHDIAAGTFVVSVSAAGVPLTERMLAQGVAVKAAEMPPASPSISRTP